MKRLKKVLRRASLLRKLMGLVRFLRDEAWFAAWVRFAPKKFMDESHLRRSWDFESPEARAWHRRVLAVITAQLGGEHWGDAIEIGCSEGVFTSYLANRCRSVEAYDISPIARDRTAERCSQYSNVRVDLLDLSNDGIDGQYDLVFAMDILSCIRGRKRLAKAVGKLTGALREGGVLIYTDNSMPLEVQRAWGTHRWWGRLFAMMEPNECVQFMESKFPLSVVSREEYVGSSEGSRDQLIALLQKNSVRSGDGSVASLGTSRGTAAPPARSSG